MRLAKRGQKPAPKHPRQGLHREQEIGLSGGRMPHPIWLQQAAGHHRVGMQVQPQVLRAGVQHQTEGRRAAMNAHPARIGRQRTARLGGASLKIKKAYLYWIRFSVRRTESQTDKSPYPLDGSAPKVEEFHNTMVSHRGASGLT